MLVLKILCLIGTFGLFIAYFLAALDYKYNWGRFGGYEGMPEQQRKELWYKRIYFIAFLLFFTGLTLLLIF